MREDGQETPLLEHEVTEMLQQRNARRKEKLAQETERLEEIFADSENQNAGMLDEKDIKFLATTQVKLSQSDILRMYVKNASDLDLKQRRQVMAHIQAQRAMHAKEIFLKELSSIGRKFDEQGASVNKPFSRIKGAKNPLKLKLECITE